jgi:hypothetical protein
MPLAHTPQLQLSTIRSDVGDTIQGGIPLVSTPSVVRKRDLNVIQGGVLPLNYGVSESSVSSPSIQCTQYSIYFLG